MKFFLFLLLFLLIIPSSIFCGDGFPTPYIESFEIESLWSDFGEINFNAAGFVQDVSSVGVFKIKYWKWINNDWTYIDEYQFEEVPYTPYAGKYEIDDEYLLDEEIGAYGNGTYRFQIYAQAQTNYDYSDYETATITDITAPSTPINLSGSISEDNHPIFTWSDGGEADLRYFLLYRAHGNTSPLSWSYVGVIDGEEHSYEDESITHSPGGVGPNYVNYKLKAVDYQLNYSGYSSSVQIQYNTPFGSGKRGLVNTTIRLVPSTLELHANYPNPFNPSTTISFNIPDTKPVKLNIYNVAGQKVNTLVNGSLDAGSYQVEWKGTNMNGSKVSSGVYIYELVAGDTRMVKKMFLAK